MDKQTITKGVKGIQRALRKHSPEILTGIGIAGMIAATITAVRTTPKALRMIDEREIKDGKRLNTKEIVQTTWKCYVPAAVTGALSVACLIGASSVNAKRNAALATAYTISETALKEYREKAVEVVGPKKEQAIRDAVAKEQLVKNPIGKNEVVCTGKGEVLCYDPLSGRYFKSSADQLKKAENNLNRQMRDELHITLNEFYYEIGLSDIDVGSNLGWDIDKGYIDLDFSSQLDENGTPCLVVGHHRPPVYIF
jgi:hypothetical protein